MSVCLHNFSFKDSELTYKIANILTWHFYWRVGLGFSLMEHQEGLMMMIIVISQPNHVFNKKKIIRKPKNHLINNKFKWKEKFKLETFLKNKINKFHIALSSAVLSTLVQLIRFSEHFNNPGCKQCIQNI